jgi:predicted acyltransferase
MGFAATVLLGLFAGHLLKTGLRPMLKFILLLLIGIACLALGWAWGVCPSAVQFPIIKHVWTSSMVLWSAGWCYLLLAVFYLIIDILEYRKWAFPFIVIGVNCIFAYMAVQLFDFRKIGDVFVGGLARHLGDFGTFLRHVTAFLIIWLILLYMYRKKTFLRI